MMELIKGILFFTSVFSKIIPDESECEVTRSGPTLCDPVDCSPPGSSIHGIFQASTGVGCHFLLQCMKVKSESEVAQQCPTLRHPMDCSPPGSSVHGIFQASTGVGCHCLLHKMTQKLSYRVKLSQKEKNKYHILTHICGIQKSDIDELICKAEIETQTRRTNIWTPRGKGAWLEQEIGVDTYTLLML